MIYIDNRQDKINIDEKILETIKEIITYTLKEEEVKVNTEVSVIFIDNSTIKEINKETRDIDQVTDVLSFPMLDYPEGKIYIETYKDYEFDASYLDEGELVLGDIVLSLERAEEQSKDFGHSFLREVCYLTVHSVLHLLGYDHMEEEDKVRMRKREEEILEKFSITR
ncbi:rRNA maturation RNase YbeY [Clostridium botulinum]|uniref:Endoribonuclease YbeY n=1 Tax=Clostridium botulinum C/D str. DC5 TaxID=1443128 RepID=A0A0A0IHE6_CLOBO|nr:rRNA maturation RNase YbeY [Clostridium botulinum]KEI00962.1 heat-shock protein [Clostridium botulinum C/D str. BKT75002]KEI11128.1 heat-shock protein [Clostridium botulinum C/D str. BKT2873]KGM94060.1 heat-shock protein [Clostridium botulinum D str. CCUG 7971]KGM98990.1 heat-shock protein [Clostridium botulinum C/D str. DC5]KOC47414.1 heat-shock protein [Clostridium botulinum]